MELAPSTPLPLDPFERRAEWASAVLVLALIADHGRALTSEASVVDRSAPGATRVRTTPRRATAAGRLVRPPRSC